MKRRAFTVGTVHIDGSAQYMLDHPTCGEKSKSGSARVTAGGEEGLAVVIAAVVEREDVRVLEGGEGLGFDEAVDAVAQQVEDQNFARAIVATSRGLVVETESTYRCSEVEIDWGLEKIRVKGKFHNYIEARYGSQDKPTAPGKETRSSAIQVPRKSVLDADFDE